MSNGVRHGGVLSPILFTFYLDELLQQLSSLDIGCHVGHHFVGSLCYADDIALLAPSPSALRILLRECELFASDHNLVFNATKTQLICFRSSPKVKCIGKFSFSGHNSLTLLPTLDMFYIVHLMTVMTSRELPLKCVRKPILSKYILVV